MFISIVVVVFLAQVGAYKLVRSYLNRARQLDARSTAVLVRARGCGQQYGVTNRIGDN